MVRSGLLITKVRAPGQGTLQGLVERQPVITAPGRQHETASVFGAGCVNASDFEATPPNFVLSTLNSQLFTLPLSNFKSQIPILPPPCYQLSTSSIHSQLFQSKLPPRGKKILAQGKRGTSATLGNPPPPSHLPSPIRWERGRG
jgi:hypothetical protein